MMNSIENEEFIPILLGSDMNVYGMARSFNEAYGKSAKHMLLIN